LADAVIWSGDAAQALRESRRTEHRPARGEENPVSKSANMGLLVR